MENLDLLEKGVEKLSDDRYCISHQVEEDGYIIDEYNLGIVVEDPGIVHEIVYNKENKSRIDAICLTLPRNNMKLSEVFLNLPYGVIKKNIPGIGATSLALSSLENVIIVVPTKALAYSKYKSGFNADKTKNDYLYVGSAIEDSGKITDEIIIKYIDDIVNEDLSARLKNNGSKYCKIIVVADSLPRVMKYIDRDCRGWRFVVDEIDSYQTDGVFRPAMETVIDYYFTFPQKFRCLVSATVRPFSNPKLKNEPVIELQYKEIKKRDVVLIHTNNIHMQVCGQIESLLHSFPEDKILIAYNSIDSILKVIALLPKEIQGQCAVACGADSIPKVEEKYISLGDGLLRKNITFITCSYFVGVDITERFHLISVSDIRQIYSILSVDKLYQISGRCRHKEGVKSETIIYNSLGVDIPKDYTKYIIDKGVKLSMDICQLSNVVDSLWKKYPKLLTEKFLQLKEDVVERSKQSYYGSKPIEIVRLDKDNQLVPAYFNIDAISEFVYLRKFVYSHPEMLIRILEDSCNIVDYDFKTIPTSDRQTKVEAEIDKMIEHNNAQSILEVIGKLQELRAANNLSDRSIEHLRRERHREDYWFIDRFKELYKYVPSDILMDKLRECSNAKAYKGFMRSVKYLSLPKDNLFKLAIKDAFTLNENYTSDVILKKLNNIFGKLDIPQLDSTVTAVQELNRFCTTVRSKGTDGNYYTIRAHRPASLDFEPLSLIAADDIPYKKLFSY